MSRNTSIRFRIDGGDVQTIPPSECARILRYFWQKRNHWVPILDIAMELRTVEVHPRLSRLRNKFGILLDTQRAFDSSNPQSRKLDYRLSERIEVLGEDGDG